MMSNNEFRRALDDSLARLGRGESLEACLGAHPGQARQLGSFLRAAATLRGLNAPVPSTQAMGKARNRLLDRVAAGGGKESAVQGILKFANLAVMAIATVLVASVGIVGASELGVIPTPFASDEGETFDARVISVSTSLLYVQRSTDFVFLYLDGDTQYQDGAGNAIDRTAIQRGADVSVRANHRQGRFFDARVIRLRGGTEPTPAPTHEPEPTLEPTPVKTPEPTPVETPKPTPVETPKPTEKPTPKPTEKPVAKEFWGVVTAVHEGSINLNTDVGAVIVHTNGETQYPAGHPFAGVKVWVLGIPQADGSYVGLKITLKVAEFSGVVQQNGSPMIVKVNGSDTTIHWNADTQFPAGFPNNGDTVAIRAFKMGDGSYSATHITVKPPAPATFEGIVAQNLPGEWTLKVMVGGTEKTVCYEFAVNGGDIQAMGSTIEGKKVRIYSHPEKGFPDGSGTYFASKVESLP